MRKEGFLISIFLMISLLVMPVLSIQSSQNIPSYGTISYPTVSNLMYGVCGWPWSLTERDFQEARTLGASYIRMDFPWQAFQYSQGSAFVYSEYDQFVEWANENNIELIPILCCVPTWFNTGGDWSIPTGTSYNTFVDGFGNYVYNVVNHYKSDIKYFEIWNEPNIEAFWNDPDASLKSDWYIRGNGIQKYVTLLKESYAQAKAANPNCIIISGGLSGNDDEYVQGMYNYGAKGYFNILGIHPYFPPDASTINYDPDFTQSAYWNAYEFPRLALLRNVMVAEGDSGINMMITELGIGDGSGPEGATTEAIQARALTRVYQKLAQEFPYVIGCMWFHLRTNMENYGLLRESYVPREMYYAYKQIIPGS